MAYLLLHGLGGDRTQPLTLVGPALNGTDRVFAPDLRAHGASPLLGEPADFAFGALADELEAQVRAEIPAGEPLTVIGISLGAALALQLTARANLPITRLVLLRPAFTDHSLPPNLAVFPLIGELLRQHGVEHAETQLRRTGLYRSIRLESTLGAAGVIEQLRRPDAAQRAMRLVELPRNRAFAPGTTMTTPPATIIAAPRDPLHPLAVADLWHRTLAQSTLVTLPARDDGVKPYVAATRAAVREALR